MATMADTPQEQFDRVRRMTWQQRLAIYPADSNNLWKVSQAYRELVGLVRQQRLHPEIQGAFSDLKRVQALTADEMHLLEQYVDTHPGYPFLQQAFAEHEQTITHANNPGIFTETGDKHVLAFDNSNPLFPLHKLVIPMNKQYLSFEHFVQEASTDEIGRYFKAVLRVAQQSVQDYDAHVSPEIAAKRDYFEKAFLEMRRHYQHGRKPTPQELAIVREYITNQDGVAVRDPHTGNSGFRLMINVMPGVGGMSQPHFHTQILGGCYVQGRRHMTSDPNRVDEHAAKMYDALCR